MAARFDASRAADLGQQAGQGTPIMVTIPTDEPWVPLRILGLGLDGDQQVEADVFVLTDDEPKLLAGGPGLTFGRSEAASTSLLDDLRSDVGMGWVPDRHVAVVPRGRRRGRRAGLRPGDLGAREHAAVARSGRHRGARRGRARAARIAGTPLWPLGVGVVSGMVAVVAVLLGRGRRDERPPVTGTSA